MACSPVMLPRMPPRPDVRAVVPPTSTLLIVQAPASVQPDSWKTVAVARLATFCKTVPIRPGFGIPFSYPTNGPDRDPSEKVLCVCSCAEPERRMNEECLSVETRNALFAY